MTIYIDDDYKCYVSAADGRRAVETDFFNGKCDEWIESYRLVPSGETWTQDNGEMFRGKMVTPWKDLSEAYVAQAEYLSGQNRQYEAALTEIEVALGVTS